MGLDLAGLESAICHKISVAAPKTSQIFFSQLWLTEQLWPSLGISGQLGATLGQLLENSWTTLGQLLDNSGRIYWSTLGLVTKLVALKVGSSHRRVHFSTFPLVSDWFRRMRDSGPL